VTKCTTDSSWFVRKAAVDLISKILLGIKSNTFTLTADTNVLSGEEEAIIKAVFAPIVTGGVLDVTQLSVCLEILQNRDLLIVIFSSLYLDKVQIVERLCTVLRYLPARSSCDDETKILEILACVCESHGCWNEAKQELVLLSTTLLNDGKISSAVAVALWLLKRFVVSSD